MVFEKMLTMQGMMFFFVIIGFIVRKRRIVGTTGRLNMVDLCLYVLLPFNIFHAFLVQPHHDVWGPVVITILLSVLYNVISVASAFLLYKKTDEEKKKPLRYGTIVLCKPSNFSRLTEKAGSSHLERILPVLWLSMIPEDH